MPTIEPIHDELAEQALLGSCYVDQGSIDAVADIVTAADFFSEPHRLIWQAMAAVHRDGADVDAVTMETELSRMGRWNVCGAASYIEVLERTVPHLGHPETYARRVADLARRRDVLQRARIAAATANDPNATREQVGAAVDALRAGWDCGGLELPSLTAAEIDRLEWPNVSEWLIAGWWASEACGFLAAYEKSSKTVLAIAMALSIVNGKKWLGKWDVQRGRVVAILEEDHKRRVQRRLRRIGRALDCDWRTDDLVIAAQEGCNIQDARGRGRVAALVRRVKPVLLIVDPWRRVTPGLDEKDSERVATVLGWLRRLQVENKCAVMVLDHMRKEGSQAGGDAGRESHRIRGSGDKSAWYDSLILIKRKAEEDPEHRVRALHRDATPLSKQTLTIRWDDNTGDVSFICASAAPMMSKRQVPAGCKPPEEPDQRSAF